MDQCATDKTKPLTWQAAHDKWRGVSPICEIVLCEFPVKDTEIRQMDLFGMEGVA